MFFRNNLVRDRQKLPMQLGSVCLFLGLGLTLKSGLFAKDSMAPYAISSLLFLCGWTAGVYANYTARNEATRREFEERLDRFNSEYDPSYVGTRLS